VKRSDYSDELRRKWPLPSEGRARLFEDPRRKWLRQIINAVRHRAKRRGLEFNITADDLEVPEFCPVLGIKMVLSNKRMPAHNSPSLDRFDNSLGYIKGNVRVISHRANGLKSNATLAEMKAVVAYMEGRPVQGRSPKAVRLAEWKARQSPEWHERYRAQKREWRERHHVRHDNAMKNPTRDSGGAFCR
jgi:hypothetical protein